MSKKKTHSEEFNPKNFGRFNYDMHVDALPVWKQLGRHAMMFQVAVLGKDDLRKFPSGRDQDPEINRRCDEYIMAFVDAPEGKRPPAPPDLKVYLTMRALKACLVCKYNEQTGVPAPEFYQENFRKEIIDLLIGAWYAERYKDEIPESFKPPPPPVDTAIRLPAKRPKVKNY